MDVLSAIAIPAVVKFVELINAKDWKRASKIVLAVVTGALAGYLGLWDLNLSTGALAGLMGSGLVTVAGYASPTANVNKVDNLTVTPSK